MALTMSDGPRPKQDSNNWLRFFVAVVIGLLGGGIIWIAAPFAEQVVGVPTLTDTYLPPAALFLTLFLVLLVNPLLRRLSRGAALDRGQMAMIVGILLVSCCLPGQGLLKALPYALARAPRMSYENKQVAEAYTRMELPRSLFPGDRKLEWQKEEEPASEYFINKLPPANLKNPDGPRKSTPWHAWVGPVLTWGALLGAVWLMMAGMALIVFPQWRDNERLSFPLVRVYDSLIETPEEGRFFPPIFRRPGFWAALGAVFVLYLLTGLKQYYPARVPEIPLKWDLSRLFQEGIFRYSPWYLQINQIYFLFVGLAFFMPSRISFSIWATELIYAVYAIVVGAYFPPFYGDTVLDHRFGAMWAVALAVLWFGRMHWAHVFSSLFSFGRPDATDAERRDRIAALMFFLGAAGIFFWLLWVHVIWYWALFYVVFGFTVTLVITRIVAETGMAFVRIHFNYQMLALYLVPIKWITMQVAYFAKFVKIIFPIGSRVSFGVMATHALGLDTEATPRRQLRIGIVLVWVMMVGFVVCGGSHVYWNYHYDATLDGKTRPLNWWGLGFADQAFWDAKVVMEDREFEKPYNQVGHTVFGFGSAAALQWACLQSPKWPLHPIGILMVNSYYSDLALASVFLGWLAKMLILRYGGAKLYERARVIFIGLMVGEVFAAVFWAIVPTIQGLCGIAYHIVFIKPP